MSRNKLEYLPAAIEISGNSLKLLQLAKLKSSYKVIKADYIPLEHSPDPSGAALKRALDKLIKDNRIKGEAVTSIPLSKISVSSYALPNMPQEEVESALLWKVKQNLAPGTNFEDIYFDYACSPSAEESREIYALVFMAPKKIVSDTVKFFKALSLDLIAIDPQPYAVIELLFSLKEISEQETALVVQLGSSSSSVTVVSAGHPYLMAPLGVSGNGFTEALAGYYQLDWQQAEELKKKEGLGQLKLGEGQGASETNCFAVLSSQLENMVIDIEHTFKYFSHQLVKSKASAVERVILCGGTSGLKNLDKFLSDRLGVPVFIFDPIDFFMANSEIELGPLVKIHSTSFASVLGLGLRAEEGE